MNKLLVSSSALGVLVVAVAQSARAVTIVNTTTGLTLFESNGFENDTVGSPMSATGAGTWSAYHTDRVIADPSPGPFAGNKYAITTREPAGVGGPGANFSEQSTAGQQLHMEWYAWYPTAGDDNLVVGSRALGRITGGNYLNYDGFTFNVTGLTYTPQQWQKWELDYAIGASSYEISIDDGPAVGMDVLSAGALGRMDWGHNGNDTFYLDGAFTGPPQEFQWASSNSGDWNSAGNWIGPVPNGADAVASFLGAISGPRTVYSDSPVTVGTVTFDNANSYLLAGQGTLTLQVTAGSGLVDVKQGSHKINLPMIIASNTSLQVANAATLKISDPVTVNAGMSLTKTGTGTVTYESTINLQSGASIAFDSSQHVAALTVGVNAKATMLPNSTRVLEADSLNISATGGKLDLTDNKMIFRNQGAGTFTAGAYTGPSGLVDRGRGAAGNALWDGSGIVTSDTRAINNGDLVSIGVAQVSDVRGIAATATTTFAGQNVAGSDTIAMVTWGGDANLDGKINIDDYGRIDGNVGQSGSVFGWSKGDFNYDGKINIDDYGIIDGNINRQGTPFSTAGAVEGVAAVPEPAGIALLALGAVASIARRRRR